MLLPSPSLGRCGRVMGDPVTEHGWDRWCPPSCVTASVVVIGDIAARGVAIGGGWREKGEGRKGQPGARVNRKGNVPFVLKLGAVLDDTSPVSGWTNTVGSHRHMTWGGGEVVTQMVNNHWKIDFDKKKRPNDLTQHPITMSSEHVFPSSQAPSSPTLPYTLRATPKRPLQESLVEAPRRHRPPPTPRFTDGGVFSSRLEYGSNNITLEAGQDQDLRRSFHLTQLKRSSLHLEKCWVKQKIEEHEIALQVLKERMTDIEESIASTTSKVDRCLICMTPDTAESCRIFQRHYAATTTTHDELFTCLYVARKRRFTFAAAHLPIPPDSDHPEYQV
ncbi:hypothetical protein EDB86DRAFT_2831006 [Lactarius hatsudake]|nr:hypothetical protein EDB86DRAFT_2831006 [Lactarius hatsudake]